MQYQCLIVDDEPLARKVIRNYLSDIDGFDISGEASNVMEAFSMVEKLTIDVIFLDINMPELSGIDFIKSLSQKTSIIITTAHRDYAVEGFELNVVDYLVKPITMPRFLNALDKFRRSLSHTYPIPQVGGTPSEEYLFIKVDKRMVKTYFDEILFIESLKDYVRIVTESEQLITHSNLSNFTQLVPQDRFMRIHKSFTVSLTKVRAIEGNMVEVGNRKLPIGRNYQQSVKKEILSRKV